MNDDIKDLGCANGWKQSPDEYKKCAELDHTTTAQNIGPCYTRYTCPICKISWTEDSSD